MLGHLLAAALPRSDPFHRHIVLSRKEILVKMLSTMRSVIPRASAVQVSFDLYLCRYINIYIDCKTDADIYLCVHIDF